MGWFGQGMEESGGRGAEVSLVMKGGMRELYDRKEVKGCCCGEEKMVCCGGS
jgi:hypothetical protein